MRGEKLPITIVRRSRKYTNLEIIVLYFNSAYINIYSLKVSSKSELFSHSYEFLSDMPGKRAWESSMYCAAAAVLCTQQYSVLYMARINLHFCAVR